MAGLPNQRIIDLVSNQGFAQRHLEGYINHVYLQTLCTEKGKLCHLWVLPIQPSLDMMAILQLFEYL
jgi:hypothetical protein